MIFAVFLPDYRPANLLSFFFLFSFGRGGRGAEMGGGCLFLLLRRLVLSSSFLSDCITVTRRKHLLGTVIVTISCFPGLLLLFCLLVWPSSPPPPPSLFCTQNNPVCVADGWERYCVSVKHVPYRVWVLFADSSESPPPPPPPHPPNVIVQMECCHKPSCVAPVPYSR